MAQKSLLREGTIPHDYRSLASQIRTLGSEHDVREEYSRLRSIIRKRVERMASAGETENTFYRKFGDLGHALPSARGLSTQELSMRLSVAAHALGGGFSGTVREIKESRRAAMERLAQQAEDEGDDETAEFFRDPANINPKKWAKFQKVMGLVFSVVGKSVGSGDVEQAAAKIVLGETGKKKSVLQMAAEVTSDLGLDPDTEMNLLEFMKKRYREDGQERVSWKKAHKRRRF